MSSGRYTTEFRSEAVRQVTDRGYPVQEVAGRLGGNMISYIAEAIQALERGRP
jgi:transposase-like protein